MAGPFPDRGDLAILGLLRRVVWRPGPCCPYLGPPDEVRTREGDMVTFVYESDQVSIPRWVTDLASFRRWVDADDSPESGRIWYPKGEVWVDMTGEQIFPHVLVRGKITAVLGGLVKA